MLDGTGRHGVAYLSPDRGTVWREAATAANHQWPDGPAGYGATTSFLREAAMAEALAAPADGAALIAAFLRPPLLHGAGPTLYTAAYRPEGGRADFLWPEGGWSFSMDGFEPGARERDLPR
ncbi:hypothetical protein [Arenibaculum pallidiluteum]|uniref:hypothetical protein n=1 Tax=Arenibaculum pallidiluteum TaxID=2812559 RepID=UPI001A972FE1|nr:hypothetical protein [Arenibaculum pallidiluteum]